jgi:hypothetical protein
MKRHPVKGKICPVQEKGSLQELVGFTSYKGMRAAHREWLDAALGDGGSVREGKWAESIAACPVE